MPSWKEELAGDPDSEFLLSGIEYGFDLVNPAAVPEQVEVKNHRSALHPDMRPQVEQQIKAEIEHGNYVLTSEKPVIVSALGAIMKPEGGIRLIHDCSLPVGQSVNDYAELSEHYKFETVDRVARNLKAGMWLNKVDLKQAYRVCHISQHSQTMTGLQWCFNGENMYFYDRKLPFGGRRSPLIFHRLTQAVCRMMARRGFKTYAYIDDFITLTATKQESLEALNCLIALLRKLGFLINWKKVVDPTQDIVFLGININSIEMSLRLPDGKLRSIHAELDHMLGKKRASKRQLQSLAGRLSFAAAVVAGGRVFLRRIIDAICTLRNKSDRIILGGSLRGDIEWWHNFMQVFNGKSLLLQDHPIQSILTDASNSGAGCFFEGDWMYINWQVDYPDLKDIHINNKETLAVVFAALRWAPLWRNHRVYITSDNFCTVSALRKGTSKSKTIMQALRLLFWLSAIFNFHIKPVHVSGSLHCLADSISRLEERVHWENFHKMHNVLQYYDSADYTYHMSQGSLLHILQAHSKAVGVQSCRH